MPIPTLPGITSVTIQTPRINLHTLQSGPADATPVLFIHGNASSATYWEEVMLELPADYRAIAVDLRGYGDTEPLPVDATLGLDDMAEDLFSLIATLELGRPHIVSHSMGCGVAMKLQLLHPETVRSQAYVAPLSPYGYSGSKGVDGELCYPDGAPGGAGSANPDFVRLIGEGYRGTEEQMGPRNVMRQFYFKPPFIPAREEELLSGLLSERIGEDFYPGDMKPSENWPGVSPGKRGIVNAMSRLYFDASGIVDLEEKAPVLWIRGDADLIVSNSSMFDIAALGAMGFVPGWPGAEACPPQPMLDQTRAVLEHYAFHGGSYREEVIADTAHSPYLEKPETFNALLHAFLVEHD